MVKLIPDDESIIKTKKFTPRKVEILSQEKYSKELILGVENREKCFVTKSHFNPDKDHYYIPAFQIIELERGDESKNYALKYSPIKNISGLDDLYYDETNNIFYDLPPVKTKKNNQWVYSNDIDKASVGSINAGVFYLNVYSIEKGIKMNGRPYKISVLPSSMTIEQYKNMINDLLDIKHELVMEEKKRAKQSIQVERKNILGEIEDVVDNIKKPLDAINKRPKSNISEEIRKVSPSSVKRFNSKVLMELAMNTGRSKVNALIQKENENIYEHQMLLYALKMLKEFLRKYKKSAQKRIHLKRENIELEKKKLSNYYSVDDLEKLRIILESRNEQRLLELMMSKTENRKQNQKEQLQDFRAKVKRMNREQVIQQINMIEKKYKSYESARDEMITKDQKLDRVCEKIDRLIAYNLFNKVSDRNSRWKLTQIFSNDKNYSKLYKLLRKLDKKLEYTDSFNAEDIIVKKVDKLYEYWMLIKMLYILTIDLKWKLEDNADISKLISDFFNARKNKELEEISVRLTHEDFENKISGRRPIEMKMFYNWKFINKKTPDFALKVKVGNVKNYGINEKWFFIDAKYRDYESMGDIYWYHDINAVAIKKYIFSFDDREVGASFIAHTDPKMKYTYYGGFFNKDLVDGLPDWKLDNPSHKFGSFYFGPRNEESLLGEAEWFKTFMKLILEYHFMNEELWRICWNCGSYNTYVKNDFTEGGKEKYHITCNDCHSFWVRNHCVDNSEHKLVKHALNGYHKERIDGDPWYVKCPECDNYD